VEYVYYFVLLNAELDRKQKVNVSKYYYAYNNLAYIKYRQ